MVTIVIFLVHNHDVISYYNYILNVFKTLVQLALKNSSSYSHSKWHDGVSKSSNLCIKGCEKWWSLIKLLIPVSFLAITNSHYACIYKQMSNVLWGFEMVWFPYYEFVWIYWILAYPTLDIAWFILAFYKKKAINPWCSFMYRFQHSCL